MRAVIYARYSSDNQRDASIEDQVRLCRERIDREGWMQGQTYADRAMTGGNLLRPGIQALIEDAMAGRFDVLVAEALDRISRDQADVAAFYKRMKFAEIAIVTLSEGEIGDLHVGLKGTMNALYLQDLADKTRRGLRGRVEAGRSGGGNSYGYDVVAVAPGDQTAERGQRRINAAEATIVRRIFTDFADGRSPRGIAFALNAEGVAGPTGRSWGPSTINGNAARGTGILNNELYVGRLVWNRLRYIKDPDTGRRVSRLNPKDEWIIQEVPDLRIVPQALWDRVKARQKSARRSTRPDLKERRFWDRRRPRYLFSGLMRCGVCGGGYSKISANLFGCSTARNKGTCGNRLNIRRDVVEASVLGGLRRHLMDPDLFKEFADEFYREVNRLRMAETARYAAARDELARIDRRLKKIVDAIAEGVPGRTLKDELVALEARQDELRALLAGQGPAQPLLHPNLAEVYRRKVADLHQALESEETKAEAAEIIRGLVDAIVLTPENGELRIDLHGDLAGILALAADGKKPAAMSRDGLEQIKVVAGACNHRELTLAVPV